PWASARTPQSAQPTRSAVVSTSTTTSVGVSYTARTRKPSRPSSASARPVPSPLPGVSLFFVVVTSHEDGGAPDPSGGPSATDHSPLQREGPDVLPADQAGLHCGAHHVPEHARDPRRPP